MKNEFIKRSRIATRTKNKFSSMTTEDMKEMNEVTKRGRGLDNLHLHLKEEYEKHLNNKKEEGD